MQRLDLSTLAGFASTALSVTLFVLIGGWIRLLVILTVAQRREHAGSVLVAGRPVHLHEVIVPLRAFIRDALDLDAVPAGLVIANQGPARPATAGGGGGRGVGKGGGMAMGIGAAIGWVGLNVGDGADVTAGDAHDVRPG